MSRQRLQRLQKCQYSTSWFLDFSVLSNHMARQARTGDTVSVESRETTENKIHWPQGHPLAAATTCHLPFYYLMGRCRGANTTMAGGSPTRPHSLFGTSLPSIWPLSLPASITGPAGAPVVRAALPYGQYLVLPSLVAARLASISHRETREG